VVNARLKKILNRFADVRGPEVNAAFYLSSLFFLITFSFYIIKPVKESFLISLINPAWWPYADLATALLVGFVVALNIRLLNRLPRRLYLSATILFFIGCLFLLWFVFDIHDKSLALSPTIDAPGILGALSLQLAVQKSWPLAVFVFCFWSDLFIATAVTQFWIAINDVFDPYQAKRLVGLFVTGGLIGGIGGSLTASLLVYALKLSPKNLLLVCPGVLLLALTMVNLIYAEQKKLREGAEVNPAQAGSRVGALESFLAVKRNRYLLLLAGVLASAMVAGSLINFQFKIVVRAMIGDADDRTSFLAAFFLGILVVSTVFHLVTTGRVLKNFGIRAALLFAPVLLLGGSAAVFAIPAGALMVWAGFLRGGDKIFDNTISQSVRELLYIPVPAEVKYKAKLFIDMFVNKLATGLGAALFLVLYNVRGLVYKTPAVQVREVGVLVLGFVGLWIILIGVAYAEYPAVLKKDIRRRWADGDRIVQEHVDGDLVRDVFDALQSRERSSTLYFMNVFDLVRKNNLTPELKEVLGFKRDELRARSMDCLLDVGGQVFFTGLEEAIADKDFESEVNLIFLLPAYQEVMGKRLAELAGSGSEVDRMEAAKLVGLMVPADATLLALERLLQDPSSDVATYALRSAAVHRRPEHIPLILGRLANPMTCQEARATLTAYGDGIEGALESALGEDPVPLEVRRAVPEVLARFGTQRGADILLAELARRREDMEQELVEALYKIRADRAQVRFRKKSVQPEVLFLIRNGYDIALAPPGPAERGEEAPAPVSQARAALDLKLKRVFDLLTLIHPPEDIVKAYQNILQGTRKSVDYSLQLLDNLLDRELKAVLFPLIEDLPPEERAQRLKKAMRLK
jgi:AAA family ATP:ADP antiporter